jgi:hypothetical protein
MKSELIRLLGFFLSCYGLGCPDHRLIVVECVYRFDCLVLYSLLSVMTKPYVVPSDHHFSYATCKALETKTFSLTSALSCQRRDLLTRTNHRSFQQEALISLDGPHLQLCFHF